MTTTQITSLATATPAEIDTELFAAEVAVATAALQIARAEDAIENAAARYLTAKNIEKLWAEIGAATVERASARLIVTSHTDEYHRRGGWTRYALCQSHDGHVHTATDSAWACSTLTYKSQMAWLPSLSGLTADEMIEQIGCDACTVCFPQAPVSAAWARTETARRQRTDEERRIKKAIARARLAKKVASATARALADRNRRDGIALGPSYRSAADMTLEYALTDLSMWDRANPGLAETAAADAAAVTQAILTGEHDKLAREAASYRAMADRAAGKSWGADSERQAARYEAKLARWVAAHPGFVPTPDAAAADTTLPTVTAAAPVAAS